MAHDDDKTEKDEIENDESEASRESRDSTPSDPGDEATAPESHAPVAAHAHAGDGHAAAHAHDGHGLSHVLPVHMLVGVLFTLLLLTIATVSVTSFDLGQQGNLIVAMVVATVKAGLVVAFFMHLAWDNKFHLILFLTSVLFVILFLSVSATDRGEYQQDIEYFTQQQEAAK
jgi:caa(3)-type oxidase subunit IV